MAVVDDERVVADTQRFTHVVVGDQHSDATRLQEANDALDLDHGDGVDTSERFVQQDKTWLGGQCTGDLNAAAFTTGQRKRRGVA